MKRLLVLVLIVAGAWGLQQFRTDAAPGAAPDGFATADARAAVDDRALLAAIDARESGVQVGGAGHVARVLADDDRGSRHQRFILEIDPGRTLLVAHNIDLAPRIARLQAGDRVEFFGEYEWNDRGGVIHWTHHDPAGRHVDGWLRHDGRTYR